MRFRCKGAVYLNNFSLPGYKLCFSHKTNHSVFGHANIIKSKKSNIKGALWKITKEHEKELDAYEGVDYGYYYKEYFAYNGKKVLVYIQKIYYLQKPSSKYLHTIIQGYKDCFLDIKYLKKVVMNYKTNYKINW